MIEEKSALLAVWLGLLVVCSALPFGLLISRPANAWRKRLAPFVLGGALLFVAATLAELRGVPAATSPMVLSLAFLAPLAGPGGGGLALLGGLAALPLLATVTWWEPGMALALPRSLVFLTLGVLAGALPRFPFREVGLPIAPVLGTLVGLGVIAAIPMGQFGEPIAFEAIWHHWGVYVSPVQAMLAGGVPFHDFPVQYGMGPTLLITVLGRNDPWFGTYLAAAGANALYLPTLGACVLLVLRQAPRGLALLALFALLFAVILWTGDPPNFLIPLATPSVGGLRFLPLALLLLHILYCESTDRRGTASGFLLWLFGLAWSPEAGVYATIVWFPYLGLRAAQKSGADTLRSVAWAALRGAGIALASVAVGLSILALLFRVGFGDWPSVSGFLTYVLNPPGILPPNPLGPIGLVAAALGIGALALTRSDSRGMRTGSACLLGLVAVSSYYLGRSHDNNVLNLFPFVALLLASALAVPLPPLLEGFSRIVLVGIIAWTATFGFQSWTDAIRSGEAGVIGPARILDRVRLAAPDAWSLADGALVNVPGPRASFSDAGAALAWLAGQKAGQPLIVNQAYIMPRYPPAPAWTGMNNIANGGLLPPEIITKFIRNGAATFHRPGWLLVDRAQPGNWLDLFRSAYNVADERAFGGYTAYHLVPK